MAATSSLKPKVIAGAWGAVGSSGAYALYRHIENFEARTPCIVDAVRAASASGDVRAAIGAGDVSIVRWGRSSVVDERRGLARASFEVRGPSGKAFVVFGARRQARVQEAIAEAMEDEDDEEDLKGWRRYFYRPWELKQRIVHAFTQRKAASVEAGEVAEDPAWDLDTLFVLPGGDAKRPVVLMGDPVSLPEYEALCVRRDAMAKSDYARRQLRVVGGLALAGASVAGGLRLTKSWRVSQSYGFIRRALLQHSEVAAALGPGVQVQSSSGTFGAKYINARLRLVSDGGGDVADVFVVAMRDSATAAAGGAPWKVMQATMNLSGLDRKLDKSQF